MTDDDFEIIMDPDDWDPDAEAPLEGSGVEPDLPFGDPDSDWYAPREKDPRAFTRVAVLGAGTMGPSIAQLCAMAGYGVTLHDIDLVAVEMGMERIRTSLEVGVQEGTVATGVQETTVAALSTTTDLAEAVAGAGLIIEAVPESPEIKKELFFRVEELIPAETLVATNTSSIAIAELASVLEHPGRFLGLHFHPPVLTSALVEIVVGEATSQETLDIANRFVNRLNREPVIVRDTPGFASSRLGVALALEAMRMVEAGVADVQSIDRSMELGSGHPMGPLRRADLMGLDVQLGIADYLHGALGSEVFRAPEILRRKVTDGELGKKSGIGFYDWGSSDI